MTPPKREDSTMTRIRILKRDEMTDEQGRVYDEIEAAGGPLGGPYWAYIRMPRLMRLAQDVGNCLRASPLSGRERQIAVLTVVRHWDGEFPWAVQVKASLAAGVDQAIVDAINARETPQLSDPREKAAHAVARELLADHGLSDATYANADALFSEEELVALVAVIGQFSMVCCTANAFDATPPAREPARLAT
jgi:4-carboxymuconolactone decarboxylase